MVKTTLKVSLSTPGVRLQSSSLSVGGSIGTAFWTRYTVVARFLASRSRGVLGCRTRPVSNWNPDKRGGGTNLDKISNIRDMNSDFESAVFILDNVKSVVEILCRLRIDGEDSVSPEITSDLGSFLAWQSKESEGDMSMEGEQ